MKFHRQFSDDLVRPTILLAILGVSLGLARRIGVLEIQAGRYDRAEALIQEAIAIDPHNFLLRLQLAEACARQNKTAAALEALQAAQVCPHPAADAELIRQIRTRLAAAAR